MGKLLFCDIDLDQRSHQKSLLDACLWIVSVDVD
jgi:hypothetical protein